MVGRRTEKWGESAWNHPESQYEKMNLVQRPSSLSRVEHAVECEADLKIYVYIVKFQVHSP